MATGNDSLRTAAMTAEETAAGAAPWLGVASTGARLPHKWQAVPSTPATPERQPKAERFVFSPNADNANDVKMKKLEAKIKELEAVIQNFNAWIPTLMADQKKKKEHHDKDKGKDKEKDEDIFKPMQPKDMKPPFEFGRKQGDFSLMA